MSTWILLRGLTRESRHWGRFPEALREAVTAARVVALDLPGNGVLHATKSPLSIEATTEYCRAELRERGSAPPFYLLAMSLGAMVTVAWASRHPEELRGCVLINTSLRPFSPFYWRLRPANYATLLRLLLLEPTAREREEAILRLTSRHSQSTASVLKDWIAWRNEHPVSCANTLRQLIAAARYRSPRTRPAPRMLVLTSTHDELVDTRCSRALALAWNCDTAAHPNAGHDIALDDGRWVANEVRNWLHREHATRVKCSA